MACSLENAFVVKLVVCSVLVLVLLPACGGGEDVGTKAERGPIETLTLDNFTTLLTLDEVEKVLKIDVPLRRKIRDVKEMSETVDPEQVASLDSAYMLTFEADYGFRGMTFAAIDFVSVDSAQEHFARLKEDTPGAIEETLVIGDSALLVRVDFNGIGSAVMFIKGDKTVSLHTTRVEGDEPLINHEGLQQLAMGVAKRLR